MSVKCTVPQTKFGANQISTGFWGNTWNIGAGGIFRFQSHAPCKPIDSDAKTAQMRQSHAFHSKNCKFLIHWPKILKTTKTWDTEHCRLSLPWILADSRSSFFLQQTPTKASQWVEMWGRKCCNNLETDLSYYETIIESHIQAFAKINILVDPEW